MPIESPPTTSPVTSDALEPLTGQMVDSRMMARDWVQWFFALTGQIDKTAATAAVVRLPPTQVGSVELTAVMPLTADGLYRVSYYARITQPGSVSSSLTITLRWTDGGVPQSYTGPAITGNTTSTTQAGTTLVRGDAATGIYYQTAYAADIANSMQYSLEIVVEAVQ